MTSAVVCLNAKTLTQTDRGIFCVYVLYGCMCKFVCMCVCVFVWNLICASGPVALVFLHPKSKLCNYDDRLVLFLSHLCLSLSHFVCRSLFSVFISLSLKPVCLYFLKEINSQYLDNMF